MPYLPNFIFPSQRTETEFLYPKELSRDEIINGTDRPIHMRYYRGSYYPFNLLADIGMRYIRFDRITIFCGGNGCGKTTALNVIAEKLGLARDSLFNTSKLFPDYVNFCSFAEEDTHVPPSSKIIVSDDVFRYSMAQREYNHYYGQKSIELQKAQVILQKDVLKDPNLHSLEDYSRWKARNEAAASTQDAFIRKHIGEEATERSNGESALYYFVKNMDDPGLYLLDEPENSLSLEKQKELAQYLETSAKYFDYQFIIATHSPIFLAMNGAKIYDMDQNPVQVRKWTELEGMKAWYQFFKDHRADFGELSDDPPSDAYEQFVLPDM